MTWDLLIKNAIIIDGTGKPPFQGNVAIERTQITAVGARGNTEARSVLDAGGKYLAPGFIDIHTHADLIYPLEHGKQFQLLEGKVRQGITTEIVGNCGLGVFPLTHESEPLIRGILAWMTPRDFPWSWNSVGSYLRHVEDHRILLNLGALQAHGPLRLGAMGLVHGAADPGSLAMMRSWLEQSLDEGSFGLSTGLIYPPGMYSPTEELLALARVTAKKDAVVTSHVRGSSETLLDAVREILSIATRSGAHVHHSHNEAVGRRHWQKIENVLEMEERASRDGARITYDMFPYFGAATMMLAIYPPWSLEGGVPLLLRRLKDPETRARIRRDIETVAPQWPPWEENRWPHNLVRATGWDQIYIGSVDNPSLAKFEGLNLADLGRAVGKHPFDAISDLMIEADGLISQVIFEISGAEGEEEHLEHLVKHKLGAFATDANDYGKGKPHPASYGAFTRVLQRYVLQRKVLTLEQAIRKMTAYPAELLQIEKRGKIHQGYFADLILFDLEKIESPATFPNPRRFSQGIESVWINGVAVLKEGKYQPSLAGSVLRRNG